MGFFFASFFHSFTGSTVTGGCFLGLLPSVVGYTAWRHSPVWTQRRTQVPCSPSPDRSAHKHLWEHCKVLELQKGCDAARWCCCYLDPWPRLRWGKLTPGRPRRSRRRVWWASSWSRASVNGQSRVHQLAARQFHLLHQKLCTRGATSQSRISTCSQGCWAPNQVALLCDIPSTVLILMKGLVAALLLLASKCQRSQQSGMLQGIQEWCGPAARSAKQPVHCSSKWPQLIQWDSCHRRSQQVRDAATLIFLETLWAICHLDLSTGAVGVVKTSGSRFQKWLDATGAECKGWYQGENQEPESPRSSKGKKVLRRAQRWWSRSSRWWWPHSKGSHYCVTECPWQPPMPNSAKRGAFCADSRPEVCIRTCCLYTCMKLHSSQHLQYSVSGYLGGSRCTLLKNCVGVVSFLRVVKEFGKLVPSKKQR